ncbi:MAG: valine--tRNA ligase [Alphaproteobacteria bacterium]|nr:valine--tRNA ligase [Alphaproteobacteria bacterium]
MIEKTYDPATVEGRIYDAWEQAGSFKAGAGAKPGAPAYCIVIPPPNVTGSLHIGHALNNSLQDVLVRFERMNGRNVLWQPGMDHAGIATQMIVERQLAERGEPGRQELGRDKFLERVWQWKGESGGEILDQLKRLGASCDWSRERFTMDEGLSEAVRKVFVDLHGRGLIYRAKRLVNWHPELQTAISDLEVENIEVDGHLWHLRYPLADGETYAHPVEFDETGKATRFETRNYLVVATTRPETMLGDTGVAVNASDPRYAGLIGKFVELPLVGRKIPIIADDHADPEQGSGAVKITPAHDFNDFGVGQRHDLPQINIFTPDACINDAAPEPYRGLDRFEARKKVLADLGELGALDHVEDKKVMVPHDEKSKLVIIEPYLTDQWFADAKTLAAPARDSVRAGRTKFVPKSYENTYFAWMDSIQPWCISRQLWWGHRIPAWYGPDGEVFVAPDEAAASEMAKAHYGKPADLVRDPDVLDTWFSSALWPFSTLGWPEQTDELATYYPTSVLVTGFDIIFFWVARMMMMGLELTKTEPFHTVYMHALVRDEQGQKMSKTKGNVINPIELFDKYGADATRFTLIAMAAQGRDIKLSLSRVEGYRNFVTKLWNATRFLQMNECRPVPGFDAAGVTLGVNKWIIGETARAADAVTKAIREYRFNDTANASYEFVWHIFCDWYVELAKPVFSGDNEAAKTETRATAAFVLDQILKILHPLMPFVTEELWHQTASESAGRDTQLMLSAWPELEGFEDPEADAEIGWLIELVTGVRSVRAEMNVPAGAKVPLIGVGASNKTKSRLKTHRDLIMRLARIETLSEAETVPEGCAQIVLGEVTWCLPLADVLDLGAERDRLNRDIARLDDEIFRIDKKLANTKFMERAPEKIIAEQHTRRSEFVERRQRVTEALARLP